MNILLDECLPRRLSDLLKGHHVKTVQQMGWSSCTNGGLLNLIQGKFDIFITIDGSLVFQQHIKDLSFALIVLSASTNQLEHLEPLVPLILKALETIQPGQVVNISS